MSITDAFPLTVVMPTISACTAASKMAMASSCPGSQSIRIRGRGTKAEAIGVRPKLPHAIVRGLRCQSMASVHVLGSLNVDHPVRVARHPDIGETVLGEALAPTPEGRA